MSHVQYVASLRVLNCATCGCLFAVPEIITEPERARGETRRVFCPNGHKNYFDPPEPEPKKLTIELRRARVIAAHEREQAEARQSEQRGGTP